MTLLDIHGQQKRFEPPVAQAPARAPATRYLALFETILDNPLLPSLAFGLFFHAVRFVMHLALNGGPAGFLPAAAAPLQYLAWLPEFLVPYAALRVISSGYRKTSESMHERILEGLERGNEIQKVSILGFAKISEVRDPDTGDHIIRMSHYSRMLAQEMAKFPEYSSYITRTYCDEIFIAAPLHDIGKVGIRDDILKKRGGLTADEFEIMKMHTIIGGDLLHELELKLGWRTFYSLSKEIAYHHHQRYDGTGYPNVLGATKAMFVEPGIGKPLKGKSIPLSARIVAMADVYDALVSRRCYKEPIPHERAREMIVGESGKHFDPDLVEAFLRIEKELIRVSREFSK
ncbi:MAG: putative sensor protein [Fibrobacteres bacterium]|nr:putative sensor protein [Fibrobacterota bacterium]